MFMLIWPHRRRPAGEGTHVGGQGEGEKVSRGRPTDLNGGRRKKGEREEVRQEGFKW